MLTIGINAQLLSGRPGYRRAGIHHYMAQLLRHLPPTSGLNYHIFTNAAPAGIPLPPRPDMTIRSTRWPTERRLVRILWEQTGWPWAGRRVDLLHSLAFVTPVATQKPTMVTVYDVSFMQEPESFPRPQRWYLQTQTGRSVRQARHVFTISESGKQDVHRLFDVPLEKISVIYPGVDEQFQPADPLKLAAFRHQQQLPERFLLHVGTLQPRKNIPVLLAALAQIPDKTIPLYLIGGQGWLYETIFARVTALGLTERVHFTGYVPDAALPLWYSAATALIFPSLYEGFGLPVVEAKACGTPVIASNVSAIPEAAGEAALLFDPRDSGALAERMMSVLDDSAQRDRMSDLGRRETGRFSWSRSAAKLTEVYQQSVT